MSDRLLNKNDKLFRKESSDRGDTLLGVPLYSETIAISRYLYALLLFLVAIVVFAVLVPIKNTVDLNGTLTVSPALVNLKNTKNAELLRVHSVAKAYVSAGDTLYVMKPLLSEQDIVEVNSEFESLKLQIQTAELDILQHKDVYTKEMARINKELSYFQKNAETLNAHLIKLILRKKEIEIFLVKLKQGGSTIYQLKDAENQQWEIEDAMRVSKAASEKNTLEINRINKDSEILSTAYKREMVSLEHRLTDANSELNIKDNKSTYIIKAPTSGYFHTNIDTAGTILEAGTNLGYIVQDQYQYFVEINATTKQVYKIAVDQYATLETELFPKSEYGLFDGTVSSVRNRADSTKEESQAKSMPFIVKVKIEDELLFQLLSDSDIYEHVSVRVRVITEKVKIWQIFFDTN